MNRLAKGCAESLRPAPKRKHSGPTVVVPHWHAQTGGLQQLLYTSAQHFGVHAAKIVGNECAVVTSVSLRHQNLALPECFRAYIAALSI